MLLLFGNFAILRFVVYEEDVEQLQEGIVAEELFFFSETFEMGLQYSFLAQYGIPIHVQKRSIMILWFASLTWFSSWYPMSQTEGHK